MSEMIGILNSFERDLATLESELAAAQARIVELEAKVWTDPLVEILNRRGFERDLERGLAYVTRYGSTAALVFIDLDGFKAVNDEHGHLAGDALLKVVGQTLSRSVRASDSVGRFGGDEFAVLLWNASEASARAKALALEKSVAGVRLHHDGVVLSVKASVGTTMLQPGERLQDVLARADAEMYARKPPASAGLAA